MKIRVSTIVMVAVWFATFVLYVFVRPDDSTGLPLKMIPLLTQTEEPAPTTTEPTSTTAVSPSPSTTEPAAPTTTSGESPPSG